MIRFSSSLAGRSGKSAARHPVIVYLAGLGSRSSRVATVGALKRIAALVPSFTLVEPHVEAWDAAAVLSLRSLLAARYAPATANGSLAALRGVLKAAVMLKAIPRDRYVDACDAIEPVRGSRPRPGRAIPADELRRLFAACEVEGVPGELFAKSLMRTKRNAAILALLYGCGLRRAELAALRIDDVDVAAQRVRVAGKGNRVRHVPIGVGVWPHVSAWLALRFPPFGAPELPRTAPLFQAHPSVYTSDPLSASGVYNVVRTLAWKAALPDLSPHDCRRTFVGDLLERGADVVTVAALAGHSSVATTQGYDRRPERAQRAAVDLLELPATRADEPRAAHAAGRSSSAPPPRDRSG